MNDIPSFLGYNTLGIYLINNPIIYKALKTNLLYTYSLNCNIEVHNINQDIINKIMLLIIQLLVSDKYIVRNGIKYESLEDKLTHLMNISCLGVDFKYFIQYFSLYNYNYKWEFIENE